MILSTASNAKEEEQSVSGILSVINEEKKRRDPIRFSGANETKNKNKQILQSDLEQQRKNKRMELFKKRREDSATPDKYCYNNNQQPEEHHQQTTTMNKTTEKQQLNNTPMKSKRSGLKGNNLVEDNKGKMQKDIHVARARKSKEKREARRLKKTAAAAVIVTAASNQESGENNDETDAETLQAKDVRDEATQLLAKIQKVEEERIAKGMKKVASEQQQIAKKASST